MNNNRRHYSFSLPLDATQPPASIVWENLKKMAEKDGYLIDYVATKPNKHNISYIGVCTQ